METIFLSIVIFLFVLAIFDLMVGVSNDAVNFLNSAVGAKAAPFKAIILIAAIGVFTGAALSNGMMEIARHGIYQPQYFYFTEIICILLAVMLTDVVLLDVFNSLGMPTSTTVSLVFELLGATFAISLIKITGSDSLTLGNLINTDKALSVIMAIFVSIAIAFFFGAIVQFISRAIFSFNYKKRMKYSIGLFGGVAVTSIIYFMVFKGLKDSSFMTKENLAWLSAQTPFLITTIFIGSTILMQVLHWLKVNVFKVIVLLGTFALALAFAGNDLVNFIGIPLAGYSAFLDYTQNAMGVAPDQFLMTSLLGPAQTPWYFLIGAGAIMVYALFTSKKAHNVIKTSVDLSRQNEQNESFGTTPMARTLVRISLNAANKINKYIPKSVQLWIDGRFQKEEIILEDGAAFDLVRASVNLVLAGLLVAVGTSLKLPLSTTYVTFMVAMGTSLADKAWGRDSAVYRITGVLSVIGGWFITAGAAFTISFITALIIHYGGPVAIIVLILLAILSLVRSQVLYKKKKEREKESEYAEQVLLNKVTNNGEGLSLLRTLTRNELCEVIEYAKGSYEEMLDSFAEENLKSLRREMGMNKQKKREIKEMKRTGTIALCKLSHKIIADKGVYYAQCNDFASEIVYCLGRICDPCLEHIDNNFKPLQEEQASEILQVRKIVKGFLSDVKHSLENNNYTHFDLQMAARETLQQNLSLLKKEELKRIQTQPASIKVSMVYLTIIQETQNLITYTTNLLKVSRKFQLEE